MVCEMGCRVCPCPPASLPSSWPVRFCLFGLGWSPRRSPKPCGPLEPQCIFPSYSPSLPSLHLQGRIGKVKPDAAHGAGQVPRPAKKSLLVCLCMLPTHLGQVPGGLDRVAGCGALAPGLP